MADNNPNPTPAPEQTQARPYFSTPAGLITGGLLMWVCIFRRSAVP